MRNIHRFLRSLVVIMIHRLKQTVVTDAHSVSYLADIGLILAYLNKIMNMFTPCQFLVLDSLILDPSIYTLPSLK